MKAGKWNYKTKKYDEYELPEKTFLFSNDMDKKVACASCSKVLIYGSCYTSKEIHNPDGFGYPVCKDCYDIELNNSKLNNK